MSNTTKTYNPGYSKRKKYVLNKLRNMGLLPEGNINTTYSAYNKKFNVYWANPKRELLNDKWCLIFDDKENYIMHVFLFDKFDSFIVRVDKPNLIDIQAIINEDNSFYEKRSRVYLDPYLVATIDYTNDFNNQNI